MQNFIGAPPDDERPGRDVFRMSPRQISELIELVARSLRPIYPLETDCGFDELLRALDESGL